LGFSRWRARVDDRANPAPGSDTDAQERALETIRGAFRSSLGSAGSGAAATHLRLSWVPASSPSRRAQDQTGRAASVHSTVSVASATTNRAEGGADELVTGRKNPDHESKCECVRDTEIESTIHVAIVREEAYRDVEPGARTAG